jgi:putative membrane protein
MAIKLKRSEWAVLIFTVAYVVVFGGAFLAAGNGEFVWYVITLVFFLGLIAATQRVAKFPALILWGLSLWGLAHMAGGGVTVGNGVLYSYVLLPLADNGELVLLKYDQIVHFYGFGVATLVLWHVLRRNFPALDGTKTIYAFAILGGMGLGVLNELIEFTAVLVFPDTNVGGYFNTALDMVFNTLGALTAAVLASFLTPSAQRQARRQTRAVSS